MLWGLWVVSIDEISYFRSFTPACAKVSVGAGNNSRRLLNLRLLILPFPMRPFD